MRLLAFILISCVAFAASPAFANGNENNNHDHDGSSVTSTDTLEVSVGGGDINVDPAAAQALAVAGNFCSGTSAGAQGISFGGSLSITSSDCLLIYVANIYLAGGRADLAEPLLARVVDRATRHDHWIKRNIIDRLNPLKLIFD